MLGLHIRTFDRQTPAGPGSGRPQPGSDAAAYIRSYLMMRLGIGFMGICLPLALIVADWVLTDRTLRQLRGSMSAYYHSTAAGALFVGGLSITAAFLLSYMASAARTYDFWLSTLAGMAILLVAWFPTGRALGEDFRATATSCADHPGPPVCSAVQAMVHEDVVQTVHRVSAAAVVVLFALLCTVFAVREFVYGAATRSWLLSRSDDVARDLPWLFPGDRTSYPDQQQGAPPEPPLRDCVRAILGSDGRLSSRLRTYRRGLRQQGTGPAAGTRDDTGWRAAARSRQLLRAYPVLTLLILASGLYAAFGWDVPLWNDLVLGRTYVGEMGAFFAFGLAWILASDLRMLNELKAGRI